MPTQPSQLTYDGVLELFRQSDKEFNRKLDRMIEETDRKFQESAEQIKETNKRIAALGSRIGEIVENMVSGNIVEKFQALGYDVTGCSPNKSFKYKDLGISGEIDLFLDDGDVAILIEVKTTLETTDVREHIERLEKYRRYTDARRLGRQSRFIGAVAGAVVKDDAAKFAQENGLYVIVQSGDAVEIIPPPEGFSAKEW